MSETSDHILLRRAAGGLSAGAQLCRVGCAHQLRTWWPQPTLHGSECFQFAGNRCRMCGHGAEANAQQSAGRRLAAHPPMSRSPVATEGRDRTLICTAAAALECPNTYERGMLPLTCSSNSLVPCRRHHPWM